jgi:hypothetical protein
MFKAWKYRRKHRRIMEAVAATTFELYWPRAMITGKALSVIGPMTFEDLYYCAKYWSVDDLMSQPIPGPVAIRIRLGE